MQNLLYFEVLENQDDVVLCLIQDRYLNRGVKDSLIFTKMDNEYKLARAFQINNQDEHSDLCTIYKMNFTTIGDRIDLVHSKWEEIETKKKYRIGKLEQWDLD
jgi:hypothetical protein